MTHAEQEAQEARGDAALPVPLMMMSSDVPPGASGLREFQEDVHVQYILSLKSQKKSIESCMTEHMRMSGIYWGLTTLAVLGKDELMGKDQLLSWVMQCYDPISGGFSGNVGHDPHLLYTCHAILILAILDALDQVNADQVCQYVASLQQPDGSFGGDQWLEIDTKFSYCK